MIVDLLRNDLGRLCTTGSVHVPALCDLQSFDNVHHLVSTVVGTLAANVTAGQALIGCSPGGSITGAPKRRAVEIIKQLETAPRGIYCGSVFAYKASGWLQSSIAIRTLEALGDRLYCWGGGGITFDSTAEAEYQETLDKVRVFMQTLENQ
jgi:para-aminobenzoate synthetase component 1